MLRKVYRYCRVNRTKKRLKIKHLRSYKKRQTHLILTVDQKRHQRYNTSILTKVGANLEYSNY